ncbi:hypothetical protein ACVWXO_000325 [Bradyrhizobium sp. LM2.7]
MNAGECDLNGKVALVTGSSPQAPALQSHSSSPGVGRVSRCIAGVL